ncbi:hypothetical protein EIP86_005406 [Pleurotus ostreatoroseus]|nr:hypothetical protein EIP86_005406 [Pleurotus ostreatoroseus]
MAGYFSNHSQSRFLANSNAATATSTTTTASTQPPGATTQNPPPSGRPRAPSSRHFSTSLSASSGDEKAQAKDKGAGTSPANGVPAVHPLRNTWVFWFRQQRAPGNKITNYEEGIKKISAFSSVESFWSLWTHLNPPSSLLPTTDYLLFHAGIRRPVWEDPLNLAGGKWIIRLRKGLSDRLWEDLVLALIGDQFADCEPDPANAHANATANASANADSHSPDGEKPSEWPEICGCTISVRQNEDIITVWNRVDADPKVKDKINQTIRRVLGLPATTHMEYKSNNGASSPSLYHGVTHRVHSVDSMQDKSSFRVPAADRTPLP